MRKHEKKSKKKCEIDEMTILSIKSLIWKSMNVRNMNWTIVFEMKKLSINNISEKHVSINIQRRLFVITRSKRFVVQIRVILLNFRSDVLLNKDVTYFWRDHRLKSICRIKCRLFRQNQINSLFIRFFMIVIIMSRERIWQKIIVDYWSNERIQRSLNINETIYKKINVVLNIEIAIYTFVDDKINNVIVKTLLQSIFDRFIERFENVFRVVSKTWVEACLVHWTQKCNNNKKKRKRDDFFSILKSQKFFFQFDQVIINCRRSKKIINMRCKMRELISINISFANITMNDLKFELVFIEMLKKNLKFDFVTEIIYYKLRDNKKLWCSSTRFWKIALFEMYCLNLTRIFFTIDLFSENTMQILSDIWNHY